MSMKITGEQLHIWYLEAIEKIRPDSYNPNAVRPYKDLSLKQQAIDGYIAQKIEEYLLIHSRKDRLKGK